jgi:hypothetical protein
VDKSKFRMARTADMKNGLVLLSPTRCKRDIGAAIHAATECVRKRRGHRIGLRPRIPKQPREFFSCAPESLLTRTSPCERDCARIVCFCWFCQWSGPPATARLMIEQLRSGNREIEDFDALRADGAGELPIAADGILPGGSALLVSDRAQEDVGRPVEEAVVCFNAVTRREYIWEVRLHAARDCDRAARPQFCTRAMARSLLGRTPTATPQCVPRIAESQRSI